MVKFRGDLGLTLWLREKIVFGYDFMLWDLRYDKILVDVYIYEYIWREELN